VPIIGSVTFFLSAAFGGITGIAAGMAMKSAKVRNGRMAALVGFLVASVAHALSWAVWVYALLKRAEVKDVELLALILDPGLLWNAIVEINRVGAWSIKNATPTGTFLWFLWGVEAVIVVGTGVLGVATVLEAPFCEACETWTENTKALVTIAGGDENALKSRLATEPLLPLLESLGAPEPGAPRWVTLSLHQCPGCKQLNVLTADQVTRQRKDKTTTSTVARQLLLSAEETKDLLAFRDRVAALPAAAPAPA
jgi:hypothetical protein